MTDITELAQRMRTAAEKAGIEQWVNNRGEVNTADYEVDGGMYIDHICDCEIVGTESPRAEFIALVNPANILALVEALELKEEQRANWSQMAQKLGKNWMRQRSASPSWVPGNPISICAALPEMARNCIRRVARITRAGPVITGRLRWSPAPSP